MLACLGTAPAEAAGECSVQGSVLFEKDGVKVTTAGTDLDPTTTDPETIIWVDIENTADRDAYLGVTGGSVNGFMAEARLISFYVEDGEYFGGDYEAQLTIPAHSSGRYALGFYGTRAPGINTELLSSAELCFTLAEDAFTWPNYTSEPVTIVTGESAEPVDIADLGTVVLDNDILKLVIGQQDYNDWMGPVVNVYTENKTDHYIGLNAVSAEADGKYCDYIYYFDTLAPNKSSAAFMCFEGEIREMKSFENLSVSFSLREADTRNGLDTADAFLLEAVTVQYPPQNWGEYENAGLRLEIQPKYNDLVTVKIPDDSAEGILFTVSETASMEADGFDGAGWLFSIGKIDEKRMHELRCSDMSGVNIFARDENGDYYVYCHPTDVRYARASVEEMERDIGQWSMLCEWAWEVSGRFADLNGLESVSYGNSEVDIILARAAWMENRTVTLSTTEYGPVEAGGVDAEPYIDFLQKSWFMEADPEETPDGEYVVLSLPDENTRVDFFFAPGNYARVVTDWGEWLYQAGQYDDSISCADAVQGWYYAAAELAGIREPDGSLEPFCGQWAEKIAGRGRIEITHTLAPGKLKVDVRWPGSASTVTEYDEAGNSWVSETGWEESGWFAMEDSAELCWHDNNPERGGDSRFIREN